MCQKRVLGKYTAKVIEAFYRSLQIVIVKRPKNGQERWNNPSKPGKPVRKKRKAVKKWRTTEAGYQ
jgi:hypothetical protein